MPESTESSTLPVHQKYLGTFCRQLMASVLPPEALLRAAAAVPPAGVGHGGQSCFGGRVAHAAAAGQRGCAEGIPGTPSLQGHGLLPGQALGVVQMPARPAVRQQWGRPLRRRRRRVSQGRWRRWQRLVLFPHHAGRRLESTGRYKKEKLHRGMNDAHDQVWLHHFQQIFSWHHRGTCQEVNAGFAGILQTTWPFCRKHFPISDVA